jgi:hypothetical protein
MGPTPPSPSTNDKPPDQRNGHAHSDGSAIYPPPLTSVAAATARSDGGNDERDESDEDSSPNHSPNDTLLTLGERLNRQLQQGAVAPIDNSNNNAPPPSPFRHSIMNSNITSLTSANLLNSALERRRFSTPAKPDDAGNRIPGTATAGLTNSDEGWERMRRSRGHTPSSVMGQQGSAETEEEDGGRSNGHATDGDTSANGNTTNRPPPDIPASTKLTNNSDNNTTNDIGALSTSSTLVKQAQERRVYTAADLREIGNRTSSTTTGAPTEGWERVRRRPRVPHPPPPATTAATAQPLRRGQPT